MKDENKNITEEENKTSIAPKEEVKEDVMPKITRETLAEKKKEVEELQEELAKREKDEQRVSIEDHKHCVSCKKPMKNDKAYTQCVDCRPPQQNRRIL